MELKVIKATPRNVIAIDTEGGKKNEMPGVTTTITVAVVDENLRVLYPRKPGHSRGPIPLRSEEFNKMKKEVKKIIGGKIVVAHNVENDLQQVGLTGIRCAQTDSFGKIEHVGKHDPIIDARQHMKLALANINRLEV